MKFTVSLILMALLSFVTCLYFPWWSIAPVCFIVSVAILQKPLNAFLCGFTALFILWAGLSLQISMMNQHLLALKMVKVLLNTENPFMLILVTGLIGAVVAGFAALSGSLFRKMLKKNVE